jgi:hypothetical protein
VTLAGAALGASLGALVGIVLFRRWRRRADLGVTGIPWGDVMTLVGPIVVLIRRLMQMSRTELV